MGATACVRRSFKLARFTQGAICSAVVALLPRACSAPATPPALTTTMAILNEALTEVAIWSGMAGVVLVLAAVGLADLAVQRSLPAARGLAFVVLTGGSSVLMSGLPQMLMPGLDAQLLLPLKAAGGPLAGALALTYLGVWVGAAQDDRLVRWVVTGGGLALVLAAVVLAAAALCEVAAPVPVIAAAAGVNALSVLCAAVVAIRAVTLGDRLARWMSVACLCLAGMVAGLYAKGLQAHGFGLGTWALTAACTVGYFLIVIVLTLQRNRDLRRLKRQAQGAAQEDWGVELPRGAQLLAQVDDALWRSARVGRECVVAAVSIPNLYQLGEVDGQGLDGQILTVLAARIRRIAGFRNVVGLYHPRCFVLVISAVQDPRRGHLVAAQLRESLQKPVRVGPPHDRHVFAPLIGIGAVRVADAGGDPLALVNRAEQLALEAGHSAGGILVQQPEAAAGPAPDVTPVAI